MSRNLVGERVVVTNPRFPNLHWEGRVIAYANEPVILMETDDGYRMMMTPAWAEVVPARSNSERAEDD